MIEVSTLAALHVVHALAPRHMGVFLLAWSMSVRMLAVLKKTRGQTISVDRSCLRRLGDEVETPERQRWVGY